MTPTIDKFDTWVDLRAEHLRSSTTANRFFYFLTETANHSILWHVISVVRVVTVHRYTNRDALRVAGFLAGESALINGGIKSLFGRTRPEVEYDPPHRLRTPRTSSFPSGHATSAFGAAVLLSEGASTPAKAGWFGLAAAVSYSRIHVRLHHASDVVGGVAIGLALGMVAKKILPRR